MESLFIHVPAPYQEIPAAHIALVCERYQMTQGTGMLMVQEKGGQLQAYILVAGGILRRSYIYIRYPDNRLVEVNFSQVLNAWLTPVVLFRIVDLPNVGIEIMGLLLDGFPPEPFVSIQRQTLYGMSQSPTTETRVLRVLWKNGESFVLFEPGSQPQKLFHISGGQVLTGSNALSLFYSQKEDPVIVEWYYPRRKYEEKPAGQTMTFAQAYNALLQVLLSRYRTLVGQNLVNSAVFDINAQLVSQKAPVRITAYGWELESESLEPATLATLGKTIKQALRRNMEQILGVRQTQRIFREVRHYLAEDENVVLDTYHLFEDEA